MGASWRGTENKQHFRVIGIGAEQINSMIQFLASSHTVLYEIRAYDSVFVRFVLAIIEFLFERSQGLPELA
jgi:hypothetical protein